MCDLNSVPMFRILHFGLYTQYILNLSGIILPTTVYALYSMIPLINATLEGFSVDTVRCYCSLFVDII